MRENDTTPSSRVASDELRAIGPVAREVGLTARAIRYYEELGLLRPAVRVKGADRLFDESDVERLREIKRLREVIGFSLTEIAELLDTDDTRKQLSSQFYDTADPEVRARLLHEAIKLGERRLSLIERKLARMESICSEERDRLNRLRTLLSEEERQ